MDTVTYPDPEVRAELERWLELRIDVTEDPDLARALEVSVIPTALLVDGDGRILDRIVGFLEPGPFLDRLAAARAVRE